MNNRSRTFISFVLAVALLVPVPLASASFEGRNGKIAFSRFGTERQGIWVMRPDGTGITRLTRRNDAFPVWSPDGTTIAFLRYAADYSSSWIMVMDADGSGKHRAGTPSIGEGCSLQPPRWSYDGLFLAYADDCFDREPRVAQIRVATVAGDAEIEVTDYASLNHLSHQPWSPNLEESSQLTFTSDRDGDNEVYVMNSDGTEVTQLTTDEDDQIEAVWSPSGGSIAYSTQVIEASGSARSSIMVIDPSGGAEETLVEGTPQVTEPLWSPDGSRIAVTRRTRMGAPTAVVVDAAGTSEVTLGQGLQTASAAWAPNSNALVFAEGDVVRLRLTEHGVVKKRLTSTKAFESGVDWQALPN